MRAPDEVLALSASTEDSLSSKFAIFPLPCGA